jgi:GNAT superfamily N-acetyltransferase
MSPALAPAIAHGLAIASADPRGAEALALLAEAVTEARTRYPEEFDPAAPAPTNAPVPSRGVFLLVHRDSVPIACGALRPLDAQRAEVRRMFVTGSARRGGIARRLLAELEAHARRLGFQALRLETGNRQPEAIALYEAAGFRRIPAFGAYIGDPYSVCFEKSLVE